MPFPTTLPESRVPDPMTAPTLRWGVLGTGWIAHRFVAAAKKLTRQEILAVGSRSRGNAAAFADTYGISRRHGTYEELVADPQVDVVYVATPHNAHLPCAELALRAGKHVLIEKPLAINAEQAQQLAAVAAECGLFCMEALWTFFLPKWDVVSQVLDDGLLGVIHTVLADNGEWFASTHRILEPALAGGPMLDLGTYPFSVAVAVLGEPDSVLADGAFASTGVNGQAGALLRHGAANSVIHTTLLSATPTQVAIAGDAATLTIPGVFYRPGPFTVTSCDLRLSATYDEPLAGYDGLAYEAAETARRITAGELVSPVRTPTASIATLRVMDEVRRQLGVQFVEEGPHPDTPA